MTIILLTSIITATLSIFLYKSIRKYRYVIYPVVAIISIIAADDSNIISLGYVPLGIFIVVMFAGTLDHGMLRKRLFMVRAELAIIATILALSHGISFLEYYLDDIGIFNGDFSFYLGVLAMLIMAPLFVTSFRFIRKRFSYKQWKQLHSISYIFYGLLGLHLILIQNDRMLLYIILFSSYFVLKMTSILQHRSHQKHLRTQS
jgi:DMSO/TMAO reductase YedYZ heme-binding membrane subunit